LAAKDTASQVHNKFCRPATEPIDMNPELAFTLLATRPQEIPRLARWWCDEWGLPTRHSSFDEYVCELQALVGGVLPTHILADQSGTVVGVATLKVKLDHPLMPGQSHWLSGVYVDLPWRSRGIASSLCSEILDAARSRGVEQLYLQTERLDGGLYAKLGWMPLGHHHEEDRVEQLVMVKDLLPAAEATPWRWGGITRPCSGRVHQSALRASLARPPLKASIVRRREPAIADYLNGREQNQANRRQRR
jgi:GNAT superfamily N-acetyltransferase